MSRIVMTGASSGFGAVAAQRLVEEGARLIVGARSAAPYGECLPVDLTRLQAIRTFADAVVERLDGEPIGALVLNAGVIGRDVSGRTDDGFETTFGVNHLAHYLLLRNLAPSLAEGAVVVLTTSGTHDPETGAGLRPPRHADAALLADPARDPDADVRARKAAEHAYTASKLCALLTVRALAGQEDVRGRGITPVAFCPGQVFGTGLARNLPLVMRAGWVVMAGPVVGPIARALSPTHNTPDAAGVALAALALGRVAPPPGRTYAALRRGRITWPEPSELARDVDAGQRMWADSARLVGVEV